MIKEILRKLFALFSNAQYNPRFYHKLGYEKYFENKDYIIFKRKSGGRIIAAQDQLVVFGNLETKPYQFFLYPDRRCKAIRYKVKLNKKSFKGLLEGSKIQNILVLRYMRAIEKGKRIKDLRIVVITNKCQVFHNKPSNGTTYEGLSNPGDFLKFEESCVWDIEGRKYPSKNKNCESYETFFPGLPNENYEYHPACSLNKPLIWKTADGSTLSRFYFPFRNAKSNPFCFMGGFENDYKMSVIGSYQNAMQTGFRPCVFMSGDGGKNWFCKYEFGDLGEYSFLENECRFKVENHGNAIDFTGYDGKTTNLTFSKRIVDCKELKLTWDNKIDIIEITKNGTCLSSSPHGLCNNNVIAFFGDINKYWFANDCKITNVNYSTKLFKVMVLDEFRFVVYEYVANPANVYCCRHIHHVNRDKSGWIVGTGEIYPNSWLLFISDPESDYWVSKYNEADKKMAFTILNHSESSVQRTIGAIIKDDEFLFASDHSTLSFYKKNIDGNDLQFASTGVFKGSIFDINRAENYKCIYDSNEVGYFFKEVLGHLIYCGQLGDLAISGNSGLDWTVTKLPYSITHLDGVFENGFVCNGFVFILK